MSRRRLLPALIIFAALAGVSAYSSLRPTALTLTGIVTTDDVIVSSQVAGQISQLLVKEGDPVEKGQLIASLTPDELRADTAFYGQNVEGLSWQVRESEAALRFEQRQLSDQTSLAESTLAAIKAQVNAAAADVKAAHATYTRTQDLAHQQIASPHDLDQARATWDAAQARLDALEKQVEAQRSAVAIARSSVERVAERRSQVESAQHTQAAAAAQRAKADVRLRYAEIRAPIDGIVDVRAARSGEYVDLGEPIVTLIDPDDLWVRVDVEETYIDRVRLGDTLTVRLPSGAEQRGVVYHRSVDGAYATQRDVSRTKRDIKTFEVRLRLDKGDRRLAVGMTAYVSVPVR